MLLLILRTKTKIVCKDTALLGRDSASANYHPAPTPRAPLRRFTTAVDDLTAKRNGGAFVGAHSRGVTGKVGPCHVAKSSAM
jgi:hypothetical protein